tara:strand:+ start:56 stop:394 length:339 start_codon:yes stop_codon:yes gene_type:complete
MPNPYLAAYKKQYIRPIRQTFFLPQCKNYNYKHSYLIPKFLISSGHNGLTIGGNFLLFDAPLATSIPAVMFNPVGKLLTAMDITKKHRFSPIDNITIDDRNQHKRQNPHALP